MPQNGDVPHSTLQFQMPHFVLGGTPNLAHGGGAEVLPGMYGQGTQPWSEYDKYWYDQNHEPGPSKDYTLSDLVMVPPSVNGTPTGRVSITPRPFEFDPPTVVPPPSPGMPAVRLDHDRSGTRGQDQRRLALSTLSSAALVSQHPVLPSPYTFPTPNFLDPTAPLPALPANGLPLYSASGFDMLRMLAKVATRPNPKIMLGPVDMTCSFVVVDIRRFDSPIVYASPTFTRLTGYSEAEVLGRNCRFLQHPSGQLQRGEPRQFTAPDAVRHFHKSLLQDKECQASLINYRKGGDAFINLVTVIPISSPEDERDSESGEITHCVGFQVDLAEQPNAIMEKLRDGSYIVNYSSVGVAGLTGPGFSLLPGMPGSSMGRERRAKGVSAEMIDILRDARAYSGTRPGQAGDVGIKGARDSDRAELHSLLLENTDDFIHVVSLKGSLLYVAPAITRVLGYAPSDLIGKSIADLCHPADVVPLMRELKDASSGPPSHATPIPPPHHMHTAIPGHTHTHASLFMLPTSSHAQTHHPAPLSALPPKPVNLLFRAQHKTAGGYVWLEARGRLHVEQGKGRKAIVLVGRRVDIPKLTWGAVERGQLPSGACVRESGVYDDEYEDDDAQEEDALVCEREEDECWGLVAPNGIILSACPVGAYRLGYSTPMGAAGAGASHVLTAPGDPQNLVGRSLASLVVPQESRHVGEVLAGAACVDREETRSVRCRMSVCAPTRGNVGETTSAGSGSASEAGNVLVELRFYTHARERSGSAEERSRGPSLPPSLVFQMVFLDEMEGVREHTGTSPFELAHMSPLARGSINAAPAPAPTPDPGCIPPLETGPSYTLRSILQSVSSSLSGVEMNALPGAMPRSAHVQACTRMGTRARTRGRTLPPAHANILSELDTSPISPVSESSASTSTSASASTSVSAGSSTSPLTGADWGTLTSETSWQYELTRLRFENERMREEVRGLERVRGLGVAMGGGGLSVRGGGSGSVGRRAGSGGGGEDEGAGASYREGESPGAVGFIRGGGTSAMASLDLSRPDVMMAMQQQPLSLLPGLPPKRTRDGELKMPLA